MKERTFQVCTNCVMDTTDSKIKFDNQGVCDYCNGFNNDVKGSWNKNTHNEIELLDIAKKIKKNSRKSKYDCIIGLSGGLDSSYLCYVTKEIMGLNPLVYVVDTGWNLNVAVENIEKIVRGLDLDMYTEVVNWNEMKDLQLAFFKSQVPYQDFPQDHAIFAGLYNFAVKNKIKYVFTGANNSTEGVRPPVEWVYINDLRLMKDIHKKFGKIKKLKTFPTCGMIKYRLFYPYVKGMKRFYPLDYIHYEKKEVEIFLNDKFGWTKYENKHYENIFTRFYEGYYLPTKFNYDKRKCYYSNLILTGQMSREDALSQLLNPSYDKQLANKDMSYIAKKMGVSLEEFKIIISGDNKYYNDYKNSYGVLMFFIKMAKLVGLEKRNFR